MRQYADIKKKHEDSILFFRMGDFYEMFWEDAKTASKELDIVLTSRSSDSSSSRIPMAGVPHHSVEPYIAKLVKKGHKVAICEQLEDPKFARGIVKRDVVRVITPGTVVEEYLLSEESNNFLAALVKEGKDVGLSFVDVSTGEFFATQFTEEDEKENGKLMSEFARFKPKECLVPKNANEDKEFIRSLVATRDLAVCHYDTPYFNDASAADEYLKDHFKVVSMEAFGCGDMPQALKASGAALSYLNETQKTSLDHITKLATYSSSSFMTLDSTTLRNLEILKNVRDASNKNTLLSILDDTLTPMGSRILRKWTLRPLMDVQQISRRLQA
ncbi:MAG: DNA mismatch repair protein MutS, partial [Thermoplasmata archaeon]|nr:DNA mismatch repair protein MutS [Thermoplasmata archaeon]